jgi:hypothetical protein
MCISLMISLSFIIVIVGCQSRYLLVLLINVCSSVIGPVPVCVIGWAGEWANQARLSIKFWNLYAMQQVK